MRLFDSLCTGAILLAFFVVWEALVGWRWVDPSIVPAPSEIFAMLVRLLGREDVRMSLWVTAWEVIGAFLIAVPFGFFIGFALAESHGVGAIFRPVVNFLFGIPKSIFLPVFILIFGVGIGQKVAFGIFTTVFVVIMGGIAAVESVPRELITVSRVYGANRLQIIREIYLPAMAPILLESARLGMIFNFTAVLLAEIYGARDGLGYRIAGWGESQQMPQLFAALVIVAVAAVAVNELLRLVEGRLGFWRHTS
jgi:ABC-type nitrate/sulfonate/bicarbonate transport system permease component